MDNTFLYVSIMSSPTDILLTTVQSLMTLLGSITNGFVVVVNVHDWRLGRSLTSADYFTCSVAVSNLFLQLWSGFSGFYDLFKNSDVFCQSSFTLKMISTHCSFRVAALLCLFYCTRIVSSKNCLFRFYQRRVQSSFRKAILRAILSVFFIGFPLFGIKKEQLTPKSGNLLLNIGSVSFVNNTLIDTSFVLYRIFLLCFGYIYPLLISLVSAVCLLVSLMKHMNRMRDTMENKDGAFIAAHRRAGTTVMSMLLLILMYFVTSIISLILLYPHTDPRSVLCDFIAMLYAPALGIVLIRGNCKLRKMAAKIQREVERRMF
ncbi:taste receptor type 2 member 13-like [Engystomops pustulosus]|uniref:taste receptor type 2 member 13-like n=1 Tax=Engystomops pustulosus TaxID=76066 RepID=UPI003AFAA151